MGSVAVKAIEPSFPTATSTQNDEDGLAVPRSSLRAAPSIGCSHSETFVLSLAPTRSVFPSGIQIERATFLSSVRVMLRPAPPADGATWISLTLPVSPSRGCQYAICEPSGEKTGWTSWRSRPVRPRICPVAMSTIWIVERSLSPECGVARRTIAIDRPSGDQVNGEAGGPGGYEIGRLQDPDVRRFASPPSAGTVQTCVGSRCA